jgi:hypothetical protein
MRLWERTIIPGGLFVAALIFRVTLISKGPYHVDCLRLAMTAEAILSQGRILYLQASGLPLTAVLGAFFVKIFQNWGLGDSVQAVNFMSVFLSSAGVILFYGFLKTWCDEKIAFWGALCLAFHPIFWATSVYGNSHCPSVFFLGATLWFWAEARREAKTIWYVLTGVSWGLMAATRVQDAVFLAPPFVCVFFMDMSNSWRGSGKDRQRATQNALWMGGMAFSVTLIFYLPMLLNQAGDFGTTAFAHSVEINVLKGMAWHRGYIWQANGRHFLNAFNVAGLGMGLIGAVLLFFRQREKAVFLFLWFVPAFLFFGSLVYTRPRLFIMPNVALVVCQGFFLAHGLAKSPLKRSMYLLVFLGFLGVSVCRVYPVLHTRHTRALLPSFYEWVQQKTEASALVIERDNGLFVEHYAQRETMSLPNNLYALDRVALLAFKQKIDHFLNQGRPVYITGTGLAGYNPEFQYERFIRDHYRLCFVGHQWMESWHQGALVNRIGLMPLYELRIKDRQKGESNEREHGSSRCDRRSRTDRLCVIVPHSFGRNVRSGCESHLKFVGITSGHGRAARGCDGIAGLRVSALRKSGNT